MKTVRKLGQIIIGFCMLLPEFEYELLQFVRKLLKSAEESEHIFPHCPSTVEFNVIRESLAGGMMTIGLTRQNAHS